MDRTIDTGTDDLLARVERGVGVVVLNRPERRNALSPDMLAALASVLADMEVADDVGAVLVTGAGAAFCAGGDVKAFAARGGEGGGTSAPREERARRQQAMQRATTGRLHTMAKPTVAALPGAAAGAGLGLALGCDLRIGCPDTVIATAFGKVGLSGDYGTTWLLSRLVGPSRARRLLFLGERLDAAAAHELGLLDWMVEADALAEFALSTAADMAAGPRQALAAMKANLLDAQRCDLDDAMDREVPRHLECGVSADHREAVQAFVEKRTPVFGAGVREGS
ncbi:enoyl-CoA hydratase-related protein [Pseudonocardia sichuanensis]